MTPTIQAVGLRKRFGKTTGSGRARPGPLPGQILAVLGATANQRAREHPDVHAPRAGRAPHPGRNQHTG
jgi:hypothetical protein